LSEAGAVYAVGTQGGILNPQPANNLRVLFWYRDPAGQTHDWSNKFQFVANGGTNGAAASGVTVLGDSGDVIVAGIFYGGVLTIENNQPVTAGPVTTTFIARLSSTGAVLSASFSEGPGALETTAIASDANGNVYIGGNYSGTPVIDKVALPLSLGQDGFVARISKDGGYKWHQVFSGLGPQNVSAIAAFGNNDIAVATTFVGAMDVITMGGPKTYDALGSPDILVSRLNGGDGTALWNTQIRTPSGGNLEVGGLAANATTIALAGRFIGNIDLSIANYTNSEATGTFDSFLAILPTADGIATKSMASQAIGTQEIRSVAFDSFGDIVLGGAFSISLPLQDMMLQTTTGPDAFVAKFSPDLSTRWVQQFGADFYQGSYSVVVEHRNGNVFAGGGFEGNLTGTNPVLSSAGKLDAFLIELNN
jgi:hypothetical protein